MGDLVPYDQVERMANAIAKSGLFGIKTVDQALALMAVAQAEGRHPGSVAKDYHIIQGRPALKADAMLARFQQAGGKVEWKTYTDCNVTAMFSHPNGGSVEIVWTIEMAQRIGLSTKDSWKNYPRQMLRARVISEGIRTIYPGVIVGEYTVEEVQDFDHKPMVDITPPANPKPPAHAAQSDIQFFDLMVPGSDAPYAHCDGWDEFKAQFNDLVARVKQSEKLDEQTKAAKIKLLWETNRTVIGQQAAERLADLNG
ncbi:MAG: hypothetical protein KGJ13_10705 [Patescibacteria group bacterium]|nr:hypothetical protein [Patescibacteria group bacterium]